MKTKEEVTVEKYQNAWTNHVRELKAMWPNLNGDQLNELSKHIDAIEDLIEAAAKKMGGVK